MVERSTIEDKIRKQFQEAAKRKAFLDHAMELRYDTMKNGVKFWDANGSGRIRKGKKHYV